jgi:hypothetical protein
MIGGGKIFWELNRAKASVDKDFDNGLHFQAKYYLIRMYVTSTPECLPQALE